MVASMQSRAASAALPLTREGVSLCCLPSSLRCAVATVNVSDDARIDAAGEAALP
jgi:hypothetical protein